MDPAPMDGQTRVLPPMQSVLVVLVSVPQGIYNQEVAVFSIPQVTA